MLNKIVAVCISKQAVQWPLDSIPFYCETEGWKPFGREKTRERVAYLAERRNKAAASALEKVPDSEHLLMIDSYYASQRNQIEKLLGEYDGTCILGASTWFMDKTRIRSRARFWDSWTTPEAAALDYFPTMEGWIRVKAVGACYVYPRSVWKTTRYDVPEDLHGCEHNYFCENSGFPVNLSLNAKLWRDPVAYSWPKRIRCSLYLGRLISC